MVAPYRQARTKPRVDPAVVALATILIRVAHERREYEAMLAADQRRKDRIASAIAWAVVFFAAPCIIAYWVLWGRGKRRG
jgi:hypothetical protein